MRYSTKASRPWLGGLQLGGQRHKSGAVRLPAKRFERTDIEAVTPRRSRGEGSGSKEQGSVC